MFTSLAVTTHQREVNRPFSRYWQEALAAVGLLGWIVLTGYLLRLYWSATL